VLQLPLLDHGGNTVNELADCVSGARARWTRNAKIIGERSEQIVTGYIRERVPRATAIRHVAAEGDTPGWDFE
jgi:hypothetical protein